MRWMWIEEHISEDRFNQLVTHGVNGNYIEIVKRKQQKNTREYKVEDTSSIVVNQF